MSHFEGGYYQIKHPLIREGLYTHTAADPSAISDRALRGLNILQATPFRINAWVLDLMRQCWINGDGMSVLPSPFDTPIPGKLPDDEWEAMDKEARGRVKYERTKLHERNARLDGQRAAFLRKLEVGESMRGDPAIWFPHFLDFRGRMYPLPQDLNPQGDDIAKAQLMFAEGKRLGATGLYWLAVKLANSAGQDKLTFDERIKWVVDNEALILDSANDPLDGWRFWTTADSPWVFLSVCREWAEAHKLVNPEDFPSHQPIPLDGTCNGLQHLSLLGRDPVGARATNCSNADQRYDIYIEVANIVSKLAAQDAAAGDVEAVHWLARGIDRNVVKRAVMTTPYGVTDRGITEQLIADGHVDDMDGGMLKNAKYMRDKITQALGQTVEKARDIMAYYQGVANVLAEADLPLKWTTPSGLKVTQSYWNLRRQRIATLVGTFIMWDESKAMGLNKRKQTLASAPNIIHSYDAAMLANTVSMAHDQYGIGSFACVHDSYATHAADTTNLGKALREAAYDIYKDDWLARFDDEVRAYALGVDLPTPPPRGDFDVSQVREAAYFFA